MSVVVADIIRNQYLNDKNLEEEKVKSLIEWVNQQPFLPEIDEIQTILFLKKCNYNEEDAKNFIDTYFTFKTLFADLYLNRSPFSTLMQQALDVFLVTILPKKTPEGYSVFFVKVMDPDLDKMDIPTYIKLFDMVSTLHLYQEGGASKGYVVLLDLESMPNGILAKLHPSLMKRFFYSAQEVTPWNLRAVHYFNPFSYLKQLLNLVKPLFSVVANDFHVHSSVSELSKYVPLECLPKDYGGSQESTQVLQERIKNKLQRNSAFFEWEDTQRVDESKRVGEFRMPWNFEDDLSFKNWEID